MIIKSTEIYQLNTTFTQNVLTMVSHLNIPNPIKPDCMRQKNEGAVALSADPKIDVIMALDSETPSTKVTKTNSFRLS